MKSMRRFRHPPLGGWHLALGVTLLNDVPRLKSAEHQHPHQTPASPEGKAHGLPRCCVTPVGSPSPPVPSRPFAGAPERAAGPWRLFPCSAVTGWSAGRTTFWEVQSCRCCSLHGRVSVPCTCTSDVICPWPK